ncbi:class I SAM-dependent methyltransferase [Reyranella soli]|uniref:class I SAM-dependent methyltransferase n=1 Tax=Reyranella soli TaxID=1230389 RepID=UPI0011BE2331|nr:class I SAM-dependent methyltransferase [Reyranella soli]
MSKYWRRTLHVSLLADWKDPDCLTNVDITDMPQIEANRFGLALALCVLDYIPKAGRAVAEVGRTLKLGGTFIYWIQPYRIDHRLGSGTKVRSWQAYRDPDHVYGNAGESRACAGSSIPDCRFGPGAMAGWAKGAGLIPGIVRIRDHLSELSTVFHTAKKPHDPGLLR